MNPQSNKIILLCMRGIDDTFFTVNNINDHNGPWKLLKERFANHGYELKPIANNDLSTATNILFFDYPSLGIPRIESWVRKIIKRLLRRPAATPERATYQEAIKLGLRDRIVLMLWEPASVVPENYRSETYAKFDTILTWNDDLIDNKKFFKYYHPYPLRGEKKAIPFGDKKFLVNISMNKYSNQENELYKERRKSIAFFDKYPTFDLFGYGWNKPVTRLQRLFPFLIKKYVRYRGKCRNKLETLSQYKFSLCYENIQNINGFISEKIFDCFNAKTVPIYWGAENICEYIPADTFIDRRNFRSNAELYKFLNTMDEVRYNSYINAIENFLASNNYKKFLPENFIKTILKIFCIQ